MKWFFSCSLLVLLFSCSESPTSNKWADYQADLQYLKDSLAGKHPNLYFHLDKASFHEQIDQISSEANLAKSDSNQILMQLREAIAKLGDPHTNFGFYDYIEEAGFYPIEIFWFDDGIWITGADEAYQAVIGKKITAINGIPMKAIIEKVSNIVPKNAPYFVHKRLHYFMPKHAILSYYGITNGDAAEFTLETANGEKETMTIQVAQGEYSVDNFIHLDNPPFYWQSVLTDNEQLFRLHYFEADSILFLQYNSCWGRELEERFGDPEDAKSLPAFADFRDTIFELIENQPIQKLIFDLRFNGGGSSPQGTELIKEISQIEDLNQKGKLFVAISQHTFSSAVINAMNFRQLTEAILLGHPSGGSPNHYGETRTLVLPKTKMEVYHSTNYFKYVDEDLDAVIPDIPIETNFKTILEGKDPVYEYVKDY
ncbi:MAG: hypothetical protein AAF598_09610 [Bacteroidota bacterium]